MIQSRHSRLPSRHSSFASRGHWRSSGLFNVQSGSQTQQTEANQIINQQFMQEQIRFMNQYFGKDSPKEKNNTQIENEPSEPEPDSGASSSVDLAYVSSPGVRRGGTARARSAHE